MYSYKYTLNVLSWSEKSEELLLSVVKDEGVDFSFDRAFLSDKKIIFTIKGEKEKLDSIEIKLAKYICELSEIEYFTKTTTKLTLDMLDIPLEGCNFSLFYKDKYKKEPLVESVKLLKSGKIGLIKNTNGCFIVAISTKVAVIKRVREILENYDILPQLCKSSYQISKFAMLSKKDEELLNSNLKPFVRVKKRVMHRLEKVKNTPVGIVSLVNLYDIKLPKNSLEKYLSEEVNIPLIFQKVSLNKEIEHKVDFLFSFDKDSIEVDDTYMQIIYGEPQILKSGIGSDISVKVETGIDEEIFATNSIATAILSDDVIYLSPSGMRSRSFCILKEKKCEKHVESSTTYPVSLAHYHKSSYKDALVFEFCSDKADVLLFEDGEYQVLYSLKNSPKEYFDRCVLTSGILKELSYPKHSQQISDSHYEICHEKRFEYQLKESEIDIDFSSQGLTKEATSYLINTFTDIVTDISEEKKLPVILCGELFENKNLTENIIEYFDENSINFYISSTLALNKSVEPLGHLLDFCLKK